MFARAFWVLASCSMLAACGVPRLPLIARNPPVARHQAAAGDWRLDIARNRFSEQITCRLRDRKKRAFYQAGAIAFRFDDDWDVSQAVYRIDGGEPRRSREDLPELLRIGAPIDRGGVENTRRGLVWVPLRRLAEANRIAIQARPDRPAKTFHFRGLHGLYETAVSRDCTPDSRFVR